MRRLIIVLSSSFLFSSAAHSYELINTDLAYFDFYGEMKARALFRDELKNEYTFGDSEIGVLGKYALTDSLILVGGVEAEVNLERDEDIDVEDIYVSQYYVGFGSYTVGTLSFGKHSTSSDDFKGVDYSEVYGGKSNLNNVGVKTDTAKYRLERELYEVNATYGLESGDKNRDIAELYLKYIDGDLTFVAGIGFTSTNTLTYKQEVLYSQVSGFIDIGDYQLGSTLYLYDSDNKIVPSESSRKWAFSIAGRLMVIQDIWSYAGYEHINSDSDTGRLDGVSHNIYVGFGVRYFDWFKFYSEINYANEAAIEGFRETNIGLGATVHW